MTTMLTHTHLQLRKIGNHGNIGSYCHILSPPYCLLIEEDKRAILHTINWNHDSKH